MAQLLVRDIPRDVLEALKRRASSNGRSAEAEHRAILEQALKSGREMFRARASRLRAETQGRLEGDSADLIREDRDYYWRFDRNRGWTSGFNQTDELAETANVDVPANGRGKLSLPVSYGRYRLELADPVTHRTLRYRFFAGYSFEETRDGLGPRPDNVRLMLDKASYHAGDVAKLTVMAPHHGEALVTVEGGAHFLSLTHADDVNPHLERFLSARL